MSDEAKTTTPALDAIFDGPMARLSWANEGREKRIRDAVASDTAGLRLELDALARELDKSKRCDEFHAGHMQRWQKWAGELITRHGLQLADGLWGDDNARRFLGDELSRLAAEVARLNAEAWKARPGDAARDLLRDNTITTEHVTYWAQHTVAGDDEENFVEAAKRDIRANLARHAKGLEQYACRSRVTRAITTKYIVQVDWDRRGKWKDEEDFRHLDEAIEMCQAYDSQDRDPTPIFRVAKVTNEVVWTEDARKIARNGIYLTDAAKNGPGHVVG